MPVRSPFKRHGLAYVYNAGCRCGACTEAYKADWLVRRGKPRVERDCDQCGAGFSVSEDSRQRRCPECVPPKKKADPLYGSREWQEVRLLVLERDGHECQLRLAKCKGRANAVDHIVAVGDGGAPLDVDNLQAACMPCNSSKRNTELAEQRKAAGRVMDVQPGTNRLAVDMAIAAMRNAGRLEAVDEPYVVAARYLADAVDVPGASPGLWKEYREALEVLSKVGKDRDSDAGDALLARLSAASMGDAPQT